MSIFRGPPTKKCAQIAPSLRVAARTVGCIVALLDHIDIWPSSGALHPTVLATTHHAPIYEIGSSLLAAPDKLTTCPYLRKGGKP